MVQQDISLSPIPSPDGVIAAVNGCLAEAELAVSLRGTWPGFPDSTHWPARRAGQRQVLEITFRPAASRLGLSVHPSRATPALRARSEAAVAGRLRMHL